jgi:hypothetical protein
MNKDQNNTPQELPEPPSSGKRRHPYFTSNSAEETIRRMQGFPERIAKIKEKLDADRKSNSR